MVENIWVFGRRAEEKLFALIRNMYGMWHRYRLPFEGVDIVTPKFVADIIA
ncbi:MAG: hypothetical protein IJ661_04840 [Lachnospiraceae bacterium]|nr:hypothetical protein [Lachnospiraceae bacterium]